MTVDEWGCVPDRGCPITDCGEARGKLVGICQQSYGKLST